MKVTLSGIGVVDGSGKIGGTVFQHGRFGIICRRQFKPTTSGWAFPETNTQKANFASIATTWRSISESDQLAWIAAAPLPLSGYQYYVQLNLNYYFWNGGFLTTPPTINPLNTLSAVTLIYQASLSNYKLNGLGAGSGTGNVINLYGLNNMSTGINAPRLSQFRLFQFPPLVGGLHSYTLIPFIKGVPLTIGSKCFLQYAILDTNTGYLGPRSMLSTIVT
jgi:hypothetical protein